MNRGFMNLDASGVKEIRGAVKEILGVVSFLIEIKKLKIQNPSKIKGIKEGKKVMMWLAGLLIEKTQHDEWIEYLNELLKNKEVLLIPDPFRPNKQGYINAHAYMQGSYINELLIKKGMVKVDNNMQSSPYWKKLKEAEIVVKTNSLREKNKDL